MMTLSCNCGHTTRGDDRYLVEAEMWVHALKDHRDMLTAMTAEQIAGWLKEKDQKLSATG